MSEKTWAEHYKIHDAAVDEQHRYLFDLAAQMAKVQTKTAMIECAMNLFKHMRNHFRDEEALMKSKAYPDLNAHIEAHDYLLNRLVGISQDVPGDEFDANDMLSFMHNAFLPHTLELDMLFGKFLSQQSEHD